MGKIWERAKNVANESTSTFVVNAVVAGFLGAMLTEILTVILLLVFTLVSTVQALNYYLGASFTLVGVLMLYRVCKRRRIVSSDLPQGFNGIR